MTVDPGQENYHPEKDGPYVVATTHRAHPYGYARAYTELRRELLLESTVHPSREIGKEMRAKVEQVASVLQKDLTELYYTDEDAYKLARPE